MTPQGIKPSEFSISHTIINSLDDKILISPGSYGENSNLIYDIRIKKLIRNFNVESAIGIVEDSHLLIQGKSVERDSEIYFPFIQQD